MITVEQAQSDQEMLQGRWEYVLWNRRNNCPYHCNY